MSGAQITVEDVPPTPEQSAHTEAMLRTARLVFRGALAYTAALTLFWVVLMVVRPARVPIFRTYRPELQSLVGLVFYFVIFMLLWGYIWYDVRLFFLRRLVKMSDEDAREVFNSRMRKPFDLGRYRSLYDERKIRITDMIGRRGRFVALAMLLFMGNYANIAKTQDASQLTAWMADNLFGTLAQNWLTLAFFYSDGFLGARRVRTAEPHHGRHPGPRQLPHHQHALERLCLRDGAHLRPHGRPLPAQHPGPGLPLHLALIPRRGRCWPRSWARSSASRSCACGASGR